MLSVLLLSLFISSRGFSSSVPSIVAKMFSSTGDGFEFGRTRMLVLTVRIRGQVLMRIDREGSYGHRS